MMELFHSSEFFTSVISAKASMNRPSSNHAFCPRIRNTSTDSLCLAGRFSVVRGQVLGRTYRCAYGESSGFFCSGDSSCVDNHPVRAQNVCLFRQSSHVIFSRQSFDPADGTCPRSAQSFSFPEWRSDFSFRDFCV